MLDIFSISTAVALQQNKINRKGDYMFSDFCEIIALVVCMADILIGAALALAAGNNGNPVPAIIGIVICVISLIGVCFLEEPFVLNHCSFNTIRVILKTMG